MKTKRFTHVIPLLVLAVAIVITGCAANHQKKEKAANYFNMGNAYLKSGQFPQALREFFAAQRLSPNDARIQYYTGLAYYGNGMRKEAKTEFKKALSVKPDYSEAHNYLGTIYLEEGLYDSAIEEFKLALSNMLYETPAMALNNMGWAYYKKGEYSTALTQYKSALQREPNTVLSPLIQKNMGIAYLAGDSIPEAIHCLKKSIDMAPGMIESRYWLGMSYLESGERGKAIDEFRSVIAANPGSIFGIKAKERLDDILP